MNASQVDEALALEAEETSEAEEEDRKLIATIKALPSSQPPESRDIDGQGKGKNEKWVISMGLYGSKPKYTDGAIRNVELARVYFPHWVCRFYVTTDVPETV